MNTKPPPHPDPLAGTQRNNLIRGQLFGVPKAQVENNEYENNGNGTLEITLSIAILCIGSYRYSESYMSAHVVLNLLTEWRKSDKMRDLQRV